MTVVRLADGSLLVHGGIPRSAELDAELSPLGLVRWVVAPNRFHHLYAGQWAALPEARLYGAPGLDRKRKDLHFHGVLGSVAPDGWAGQLDQEHLRLPLLDEVVFLHRASRTLIATDLFFNYRKARDPLVRVVRWIEDCDDKFTVPRVVSMLVRDRAAFSRSVERMLSWDFDRIVLAHGDVIETDGHARAEAALRRWR